MKGLLIPRQSLGRRNVYLKLRRRGSFDFPILGVAATLDIDERGECRDATRRLNRRGFRAESRH